MSADLGLRQILRDSLPEFHWTTLETRGGGEGVPDAHGCLRGVDAWVECKGTATGRVSLRTAQTVWARQRARVGGRTYLAVRWRAARGVRREARDELWLLDGERVARLALPTRNPREQTYVLSGEAEEVLLRETGGRRTWDWGRVAEVLLSGQTAPT